MRLDELAAMISIHLGATGVETNALSPKVVIHEHNPKEALSIAKDLIIRPNSCLIVKARMSGAFAQLLSLARIEMIILQNRLHGDFVNKEGVLRQNSLYFSDFWLLFFNVSKPLMTSLVRDMGEAQMSFTWVQRMVQITRMSKKFTLNSQGGNYHKHYFLSGEDFRRHLFEDYAPRADIIPAPKTEELCDESPKQLRPKRVRKPKLKTKYDKEEE